jgi:GNAT superfamily N-acetyltransferase
MEHLSLTDTENLLVENYVDFLVALVEYGNMPHSTWEQEPHHFRLISGCEDPDCNAVFSLEEPLTDPVKIRQYIQKMKEYGFPWVWVLRDSENFRLMENALESHGLVKQAPSQGMIGTPKMFDLDFSEVKVSQVLTPYDLEIWLTLYENVFFQTEIPLIKQMFRKTLFEAGLNTHSPLQADIAYVDNQPVGCNLMFYSHEGEVGGFWCVGVLPNMRGKGIAKAMINARMQDMIDKKIPYAVTWLDQNGILFSNFSKLGFETKLKFTTFEVIPIL